MPQVADRIAALSRLKEPIERLRSHAQVRSALAAIARRLRAPTAISATAFCALLTLGTGRPNQAVTRTSVTRAVAEREAGTSVVELPCPPGMLADDDPKEGSPGVVCTKVHSETEDNAESEAFANGHHDKRGRWIVYDQIPRRPDRPQDYDAYRYPVPCEHRCVVSGYDLDRPDKEQRRGRHLSHVGHGAVDIVQERGTVISTVALEHQVGDAQVVYVGPLFGTTVITRHTLQEGGRLRDYIVLFGHLDSVAPGLNIGGLLRDGEPLGRVGNTGSADLIHLHLETRRVRDDVDIHKLSAAAMIDNESSVVCDPRNVLPIRSLNAR